MRTYFSEANLVKAAALGAVAAVLAVPRILEGEAHPRGVRIVAAFFGMTAVAGAVTAWGRCGGLAGVAQSRPCAARLLVGGFSGAWGWPMLLLCTLAGARRQSPRWGVRASWRWPSRIHRRPCWPSWRGAPGSVHFFTAAPVALLARLTRRRSLGRMGLAFFRARWSRTARKRRTAGTYPRRPSCWPRPARRRFSPCSTPALVCRSPGLFAAVLDLHLMPDVLA